MCKAQGQRYGENKGEVQGEGHVRTSMTVIVRVKVKLLFEKGKWSG